MNAGEWIEMSEWIDRCWVEAEAKREWGGVTPLGEDRAALQRLWLRRVLQFTRACASRARAG